jgi:hypothetical protein
MSSPLSTPLNTVNFGHFWYWWVRQHCYTVSPSQSGTLHRNPPNSGAKMMSRIPTCLPGSTFHAPGVLPFKIQPSQQNHMLIVLSAVVIAERPYAGAKMVILGYWNTRGCTGVHIEPYLIGEIKIALLTVQPGCWHLLVSEVGLNQISDRSTRAAHHPHTVVLKCSVCSCLGLFVHRIAPNEILP